MTPQGVVPIRLADTATRLDELCAGAVLVCGSHGGVYTGCLAARAGCSGALFNDAGIGRDQAGVAALPLLDSYGIPAAAVDHASARIGDAADMLDRGIVSAVNRTAAAAGCAIGQPVAACAELMASRPTASTIRPECKERRLLVGERAGLKAWALDSASQVGPQDSGAIVLTGSHGGLVGGQPAAALKADARVAVFNDAGVGADCAGIGRLAALAARGIAAATVSAASARIGDGLSTYQDGIISFSNEPAAALGISPGLAARTLVAELIERLAPPVELRR